MLNKSLYIVRKKVLRIFWKSVCVCLWTCHCTYFLIVCSWCMANSKESCKTIELGVPQNLKSTSSQFHLYTRCRVLCFLCTIIEYCQVVLIVKKIYDRIRWNLFESIASWLGHFYLQIIKYKMISQWKLDF